jgi:pyrroline-5-carboxylate reductase
MAAALARGWARAEHGPEQMLFCDLDAERARSVAEEVGGEARDSLAEIAAESDVVVLVVKPAALDDVAKQMRGSAPALLSVMAATPVARLSEAFPGVPVMRAIPNQPVEVGRGTCCYVEPEGMDPVLRSALVELLSELGIAVPVEEERIEVAMAVMSCAPAYVALFAQTLAEAGAAEGLDPRLSLELVAETLSGTGAMLAERDPEAIRRAVASPGGTTEAGLDALESGGFTRALEQAFEASLERFR